MWTYGLPFFPGPVEHRAEPLPLVGRIRAGRDGRSVGRERVQTGARAAACSPLAWRSTVRDRAQPQVRVQGDDLVVLRALLERVVAVCERIERDKGARVSLSDEGSFFFLWTDDVEWLVWIRAYYLAL